MNWIKRNNAGADLYIDLGTANTLVVTRQKGLVVNEPSVVAYRDDGFGRKTIIAVGSEAKTKIGRTPGNLVACLPLKEGVIADLDSTEAMLKYFLNSVRSKIQLQRPRLVVSLPYGVSDIERQAVRRAGAAAGARETLLIDEPMAAALGSGMPVAEPKGNMIIDIGGGTTEIAVISLFGIVHCEAVRIGGHAFDQAIVEYLRKQYNLVVGDPTAEKVKIAIGTALPDSHEMTTSVRGLDSVTGLPKAVEVTSSEIFEALRVPLGQICEAARRTLEETPAELVHDLLHQGALVAGGGALLRNIDVRLSREMGIPVNIAENPLTAIAIGGRVAISDREILERITLY